MQTYIDLHRHAAVRAELTGHPAVALRLMVAHAIAGSPLWNVKVEAQTTKDDDVRENVEVSRAEAVFDEKRRAVLALLGFDAEEPSVTGGNPMRLVQLFQRLDRKSVVSGKCGYVRVVPGCRRYITKKKI